MKEKRHEHKETGFYVIKMIPRIPQITVREPVYSVEKSQLYFCLHTQQTAPFNEARPALTQYQVQHDRTPTESSLSQTFL